jgi:hypothetical protein
MGTGMGIISPCGDGDGKAIPDGEFPVAIFMCDHSKIPLDFIHLIWHISKQAVII